VGIPAVLLEVLCNVASMRRGGLACSAGYPDLLVTEQQLAACLGTERAARIPVRPDSRAISAWHGVTGYLDKIFESEALFRELGYELDVIDLHAARGNEIIHDLNRPLPLDLHESYDLVLDTGTCEHCFNIGQAALNLAAIVSEGGYLVQAMPLNLYNHGFYNINPTWFHDFYPANGFRLHLFQGVSDILRDPRRFELPAYARFNDVPPNSSIIVVAEREVVRPATMPVQHKYAANPSLKN